jgi:hypothetical protein
MGVFLRAALPAALFAWLAPGSVHAYCRTTTTPLPPSYSPTRGCFSEGLLLYWRNACVSYSVQQDGTSKISLAEASAVIDASFAAWTTVTCPDSGAGVGIGASSTAPVACDKVRYNSSGPNQNLVVFREAAWPYSDPNNTLGLTTITFNAETGEIFDADMEINASGGNLSVGDPVPPNGFDLASVVTHEAGHFFGLAHATDSQATMFASYKPGSSALRELAADDVDGICAIYPSERERIVDPSVAPSGVLAAGPCDPTPRHGFGGECAPNPVSEADGGGCTLAASGRAGGARSAAAALVALVAAVRRRRRRM